MTAQEAIKDIVENGIKLGAGYYVNVEALKVAVSTLEKQIPKNPIKLKAEQDIKIGEGTWKAGTTVYKCPCCNSFISYSSNYCPKCGRALDWSDSK